MISTTTLKRKSDLLRLLRKSNLCLAFFLILLFSYKKNNAQSWLWATSQTVPWGISACDTASGAVYTTAQLSVGKHDSLGNLIWVKSFTEVDSNGTNSTVDSRCITVDPVRGNVYISGFIVGYAEFEGYDLSAGSFIIKLDSDGNVAWTKTLEAGTSDYNYIKSIDVDQMDASVYTTGSFYETVDFDLGTDTFNLTSAGGSDIFISNLDSSGNFVWAKAMGGTGDDLGVSLTVVPEAGGSIYTTGHFSGIVDFDPGTGIFNLTSAGTYDIFISKLGSSGNFVWAKAIGGETSYEEVTCIAVAGDGVVYTTGSFTGIVDFDPGAGIFNLSSSPEGGSDMFICKLGTYGSFVWVKAMGGGELNYGNIYSESLVVETGEGGSVYMTGTFDGTVDFDPGPDTFNLTAPYSPYWFVQAEMFISKLSSSGHFLWVFVPEVFSYGLSISSDAFDNIIVTGIYYEDSITFGDITLIHTPPPEGGSEGTPIADSFIAKLDGSSFPCTSIVTSTGDNGTGSLRDIISCTSVGDTITFSLPPMSEITLTSGEIVIQKNLTLTGMGNVDLSISGNNASRIFHVLPGKALTIENLSLKNATSIMNGGAIFVEGNLTLAYVTLENNFQNGIPKGLTVNSPGGLVTINGMVDIKY